MESAASEKPLGLFTFLECGNGDTILVGAGGEWGLIDCNLVGQTRPRLEQYLRDKGIDRLRFVVVTHFDKDHLHGMEGFLRSHFGPRTARTDGSFRKDWDIDQLILPVPIGEMADNLKAIVSFHEIFTELAGTAAQYCADARKMLELAMEFAERPPGKNGMLRVRDYQPKVCLDGAPRFGPFEVIFLAPAPQISQRFVRWFRRAYAAAIRYFELDGCADKRTFDADDVGAIKLFDLIKEQAKTDRFWDSRRPGWNDSSIVMAFRAPGTRHAVLLCGDLPKRRWKQVREEWQKFCGIGASDPNSVPDWPFDLVKASHHGSGPDHAKDLYERFGHSAAVDSASVVVVSAERDDPKHPHEVAVKDWHELGWKVWHTGLGQVLPRDPLPKHFPGGRRVIASGVKVEFGVVGVKPICMPV